MPNSPFNRRSHDEQVDVASRLVGQQVILELDKRRPPRGIAGQMRAGELVAVAEVLTRGCPLLILRSPEGRIYALSTYWVRHITPARPSTP
jgi:hypothetical protein